MGKNNNFEEAEQGWIAWLVDDILCFSMKTKPNW